jgi:hypothetical protein
MKGITRAVGLMLLVTHASLAHAGADRAGTSAATFLSVGSGAGVLGMGGATLALSNGLTSLPWNAGSLGLLREGEMALSHAGLESETSQEWAAFGGRLGFGEMRWAVSGLFQSEGAFEGRDASNQSTGSFNVSSMAVGATVARPLGRNASLGVGAKWVRENLGPGFEGSGLAFDAGLLVRAGMLGFGVAGQNMGGSMTFGSSSYPFPSNYGAGFSIAHAGSGLELDVDVNAPSDYYTNVRGGVEWKWRDRLALRTGYRKELGAASDDALNGPTFGMGAGACGMWLDYGYLVTKSGEGQHRVGLSLHPGNMSWTGGDPFGQKGMPREFGPENEPAKKAEPNKKG